MIDYKERINALKEYEEIEFESLINIRPRDGNRSMIIQDRELCQKVETITRQLLGDVQ